MEREGERVKKETRLVRKRIIESWGSYQGRRGVSVAADSRSENSSSWNLLLMRAAEQSPAVHQGDELYHHIYRLHVCTAMSHHHHPVSASLEQQWDLITSALITTDFKLMLLYCSCISDEKLVEERQCCFLISVFYQAAAGYFLNNVNPQQSVLHADILSCVLHILFPDVQGTICRPRATC